MTSFRGADVREKRLFLFFGGFLALVTSFRGADVKWAVLMYQPIASVYYRSVAASSFSSIYFTSFLCFLARPSSTGQYIVLGPDDDLLDRKRLPFLYSKFIYLKV